MCFGKLVSQVCYMHYKRPGRKDSLVCHRYHKCLGKQDTLIVKACLAVRLMLALIAKLLKTINSDLNIITDDMFGLSKRVDFPCNAEFQKKKTFY